MNKEVEQAVREVKGEVVHVREELKFVTDTIGGGFKILYALIAVATALIILI